MFGNTSMYVLYGPALTLRLDLRTNDPRKVLRILAAAKDGPDAPRICQPTGQLTHTVLSSAVVVYSAAAMNKSRTQRARFLLSCVEQLVVRSLKRLISLVSHVSYFTCAIEYVPSNCFITRFDAAVSVLVGPRCPALLTL